MPDASLLTSLFGEEVVTRALVRDVELPDDAGTMALITLDNGLDHTRPSTFGPAGLLALGLGGTGEETLAVAKSIKGCEATIMKGMGHFPMVENYPEFRPHLLAALDHVAA
jgi:pimeloyl-ACP methyl ester carboxylesterase